MAAVRPALLALAALLPAIGCAPPPARGLTLVAGPDAADPERPGYHDFGRVPAGERVAHAYLLRNDSAHPIAILDVVPGCGCTVPSLSYRARDGSLVQGAPVHPGRTPEAPLLELPAGRTAELSLAIDAAGVRPHNAPRLYTTRITTDSLVTPFLTLETNIVAEQPFLVVPPELELGSVPLNGGGEGRVRVSQSPGFDLELAGDASATGGFEVELVPVQSPGGPSWELVAGLPPPVASGPRRGLATLAARRSDGQPARPLLVELRATGVPDLATEPARLILIAEAGSADEPSASVELFSLVPGQRLVVQGVTVPAEHAQLLAASCSPLEPDAAGRSRRWRVTLRCVGALPESVLTGSLQVQLEGGQPQSHALAYVVHRR